MERWNLIRGFLERHLVYDIVMALGGLAAFGAVGFLGHPGDRDPFGRPWPLYTWVCLLALTLEWLIFSEFISQTPQYPPASAETAPAPLASAKVQQQAELARLHRWRAATMLVSSAAMIVVGAVYFYHPELINAITSWIPILPTALLHAPWLFTIFNFLLIVLFFADALRRWIRCMQGKPLNADEDRIFVRVTGFADLTGDHKTKQIRELHLLNLLSADFIAGGILSAGLAIVLRRQTISAFLQMAHLNRHLENCTVSLPTGACPGTTAHLTSLTQVDMGITLVCFATGLLALFFFVGFYGLLRGNAGKALWNVLLMALIFTLNYKRLFQALKVPLWAFLIVSTPICLAWATDADQQYLQQMQTALSGFAEWPIHIFLLLRVLAGGVFATVALTLAAWLAIFRKSIMWQWLREMAGFIQFLLERYWIAALFLSVVNLFLLYTQGRLSFASALADPASAVTRLPFPLAASATLVSFGYFSVVQVFALVQGQDERFPPSAGSSVSPASKHDHRSLRPQWSARRRAAPENRRGSSSRVSKPIRHVPPTGS